MFHASSRVTILLLLLVAGLSGSSRRGLAAPGDGLIFYQGFDHAGRALCAGGWATDQQVPSGLLVAGRFGKACRFERASANFLSANQSSAEAGTEGFAAGRGVGLSSVPAQTPFGKRALRAAPAAAAPVWSTAPARVKVASHYRPAKVFLFSAYLRSERPGVKVRLSLEDEAEAGDWRAPILAANEAAVKKDPKAAPKPPLETVAAPAEIALTGGWQRVDARLEVDARRPEQVLAARLEVLEGAPAAILADGLQLEQACVYPLSNTDPTSWIPGGEKRGPAWIDLVVRETGFTGERGTFGCWVRPLPDQCGGTRSVMAIATIGTGWWSPLWQVGGSQWYGGEAPTKQKRGKIAGGAAEKGLFEAGAHEGWHHLALAWDETDASAYLDGKLLGKTPLEPGRPAPGTVLRLGGSFLETTPMTGDLDEVFLYSRRLPEAEIAALAGAPAPLAAALPRILVRRPLRTTFLRSEGEARIPLEVVPYGAAPAPATVTARVPDLKASLTETVRPGKTAVLALRPWLRAPGKSELVVEAASGASRVVARDFVEVFEEPTTPEFLIYAWGGEEKDLEERGFNCLFGEPRSLLERGMWAIARIDVRDAVPHPWSAEIRSRARAAAERTARAAMAHPNVRRCLVNSECSHPPFPAAEPWFREWMKREAGLDRVPAEVANGPVRVPPREGFTPPALLPEEYPPYRFLRWWTERGQGYYLLNNQIARWMRAAGLHTTYYSDQPEVARQFEGMDLADFWGYPKTPEGLVARFSHAYNLARLDGKPFQAMPGTVYWDDGNGLWQTDTDGKRKVLCLSPDCLRENLWISVACPSTSIGLYGIGERRTEIYDKACDTTMTETYGLIRPVGVLAGGLPQEQPRVALLETDGLYFIQPGVDDWVRHWLTRTASRAMARARLPYDWITDDHVYAGWLSRYDAVFVPGAWCLPERTHKALVAYAKAGGKVIADKVMRAEIPGMQRLDIRTQAYPDEDVLRELVGWAASYRDAHPGWARVTPTADVIAYTREAGPARTLFLVNDRREPGPLYERWKVTMNAIGRKPLEPLRDKGLPQDVQVNLPAGFAVYDVLAHRRLETTPEGDRQNMAVHLEPGAAAVLAAFPRAIGKVSLRAPARLAPGTEGAMAVQVLDEAGKPVAGRQMVEVKVTQPDGSAWAGVQRYRRVADGTLTVPLRLPLTAQKGTWRVEVLEWVSGQRAQGQFVVQ